MPPTDLTVTPAPTIELTAFSGNKSERTVKIFALHAWLAAFAGLMSIVARQTAAT